MTIIRLLLDRNNLDLASPKYVRAWYATRMYAQCPDHSIAVVCLDRSSHLTLVDCIQLAYAFITLCLHQQNVQSVPEGSRRYAMVPDGTRVTYHQFGYLHPKVEANTVRGGTRWYTRMEG